VYLYYTPDLTRAAQFDDARLEGTTERHHIQLSPPPAQPAGSPAVEAPRNHAAGVVLELASGLPSQQQLEAVDAVRKSGGRVWLYWPAESAVECVDEEKVQSLRRHVRDVRRLRTIGLRIDRMSEIWQRGPTGLRWIYRGEFPVRRSDILVRLTQLTMRAQPLPLSDILRPAVYIRTDYWRRELPDQDMTETASALASATGRAVCLASRPPVSPPAGVESIVMDPPRRMGDEDAIVLAHEHYTPLVKVACQALRPSCLYDPLTAGQAIGAEISQALGIPYIVEYRGAAAPVREALGSAVPFYPELYHQAEELALRQATVVVVTTNTLKQELIGRGIDAARVVVVPSRSSLTGAIAAVADAERGRASQTRVATGDAYKDQVQNQWNQNPVGSQHAQGSQPHTLDWFLEVERHRYGVYAPWMHDVMEFGQHPGQDVLEIGGGIGTDLAQFARNGSRVTDIDLAAGHLQLAQENFQLRGLTGRFIHHDAETLPFDDASFDVVYSNGVLHHTPNTRAVVREIRRVLRPGGRAIIMLYAENSLHYWRKLVWLFGIKQGLLDRFSMGEIMSRTVERSANEARPLVKVYTPERARSLFGEFGQVDVVQRQMEPYELPAALRWALGSIERRFGWNLIIKADKTAASAGSDVRN
jgi:ubiquinone/menaquinone biosynthesis C-methylase UbiE